MRRLWAAGFIVFILILFSPGVLAAEADGSALPEQMSEGAPVIIDGVELFSIKARVTSFYQEDRARLVRERILHVAKDHNISVDYIHLRVHNEETLVEIVAGDLVLTTVTEADAEAEVQTVMEVSSHRLEQIRNAILKYRETRRAQQLALQLLKAILLTGLLALLFYLFHKGIKYFKDPVSEQRLLDKYLIKIPGIRLLPLKQVFKIISFIGVGLFSLLRILALFFYFTFVLDFFPWTAIFSKQIMAYVTSFADTAGQIILDYLPNLLIIIAVLLVAGWLRKLIRFIFRQLKGGGLKIPGFYPEWADTTYKLARFFLLAITAVVIFPYIPGSDSAAFQGVSVFLGLMVSFGSSSVISNIISGFVMTYNRAFRIGDWVQIGENRGEIIEKSMLSVRMRTTKKVDITIPNSAIINSPVVNYSTSSNDSALILHADITLDYDIPWETAHSLLIKAALATPDILQEPSPFVLQKQMLDFSMGYEINAYTNQPGKMARIYSELYKNVLEVLDEAGIGHLTPHHFVIHDDN